MDTGRISIGIDPGTKGGIVVNRTQWTMLYAGAPFLVYRADKLDRYEMRNVLERIAALHRGVKIHACIEKVSGFIGEEREGGKKNVAAAHTTFVLGRSYGNLEMALVCARISFTEVLPKEWQKRYGMKRDKGESKSKWKGRLYAKAKSLFPDASFTKELADAFLIADYCRSLKTW